MTVEIQKEINETFGEWLAEGYSPIPLLIARLEKERFEKEYYKKRVEELERKIYGAEKY